MHVKHFFFFFVGKYFDTNFAANQLLRSIIRIIFQDKAIIILTRIISIQFKIRLQYIMYV